MNDYMKRYQVRVYDNNAGRNGEFVNEYDTLEEAQAKKAELEKHRESILAGDEPDWVKGHYEDLSWTIIDLAQDKIYE